MSRREEDLERVRMIRCFGAEYANIGKTQSKGKRSIKALPEPPYQVNSLLTFIVNNGINLKKIYIDQIESNIIKVSQLREFCKHHRYNVTKGDLEVIIRFFKLPKKLPTEDGKDSNRSPSRRTSRSNSSRQPGGSDPAETEDLNLSKILAYLKRIDANYGKDIVNDAE